MYLKIGEMDALNNNLDTESKRKFLRCICLANENCSLCSIKEECEEICPQTRPIDCSDYQIHKMFEKVI